MSETFTDKILRRLRAKLGAENRYVNSGADPNNRFARGRVNGLRDAIQTILDEVEHEREADR